MIVVWTMAPAYHFPSLPPSSSLQLCLELLTTLVLRNRDRVGLLWPLLHEFLAACTSPETAEKANPLVERAVMDLFRVGFLGGGAVSLCLQEQVERNLALMCTGAAIGLLARLLAPHQ